MGITTTGSAGNSDIEIAVTAALANSIASRRVNEKLMLLKKPLIQAPLWAALTVVAAGVTRRHSNGLLMVCVSISAGATTLASEPAFSSTALMQEAAGPAWAALGTASKLNTDGYPIPIVSADQTPPEGSAVRTLAVVAPGKLLSGTIAGGSAYTNGTYTNVPLTGGAGTGAIALSIVVSGGLVTAVTISKDGTGANYLVGNVLSASAAAIGGTGSGFTYTTTSILQLPALGAPAINDFTSNLIESSSTTIRSQIFNDGGTVSPTSKAVHIFEFVTDDPKPALVIAGASAGIQIIAYIDGYPVQEDVTPFTGGGTSYYKFDWSGIRVERTYRFEIACSTNIRGISLLAQSILHPSATLPIKGQIIVDSYGGTTSPGPAALPYSTPIALSLLGAEIFKRVGVNGPRVTTVGGTGYLNGKAASDNNTTATKFNAAALVSNNIYTDMSEAALIVFAHGLNDISQVVADVVTNALYCWRQKALESPRAVIAIFGPWTENSGPGATTLTLDTALKAAFTAWGHPNSRYHSIAQDPAGAWTSGTGMWGTTTGTGNSDFYTGADAAHPSIPGRDYLVKRMTFLLEQDLLSVGY